MSIFRPEAVAHSNAPVPPEKLAVAPPWTWALFCGIGGLLVGFVIWSFFGRVPVSERGRGIILPVGGARALTSTVSGRISAVRARNGDSVKAGAVIVEIEAPSVVGPSLLAERDKTLAHEDLSLLVRKEEQFYRDQRANILNKIRSGKEQGASLAKSAEMQRRKVDATEKLYRDQLVSAFQADDAREALEMIRRQQQGLQQGLSVLAQELSALDGQNADRALQRKRDLDRVDATAEGQALAKGQAVVVATVDGVVEGLQSNLGDSILIGEEIGRILPTGLPLEVVALLPERHQAFVQEGGLAYLEIEQLPYGEFGSAKARIKRVARGTVSARETALLLGPVSGILPTEGPMIRVELDMLDQAPARKAGVTIQAGMRTQVRFQIRRQSLVSMILAPLRRWTD